MATVTVDPYQKKVCKTEEEWKQTRREHVTASEASAILGVNPYRGPWDVAAEKLGYKEIEPTPAMLRGQRMEHEVAKELQEVSGCELEDYGRYTLLESVSQPWLGATLDRVIVKGGERAPAELKWVGPWSAKEWEEDSPPIHHQIQLQIQMHVFGSSWGVLAGVLSGFDFRYYELERNPEFLESTLPYLRRFFYRLSAGELPDPDGSDQCKSTLAEHFRPAEGLQVQLDKQAMAHARLAVEHAEKAKLHEKAATEHKNALAHYMQEATDGVDKNGRRVVTYKQVQRAGYTVEPVEYRQLRIYQGAING